MQTIPTSLLIGLLCCFGACHAEAKAPNVDIPYDPTFPRVLELRILADSRHREIIALALKQQARESDDKKPWSELVVAPESKKPVARWVEVERKAQQFLTDDPKHAVREIPGDVAKKQILVILDPYDVTSDYVKSAHAGIDEWGTPAVFFALTEKGAKRFEKLTSSNLPQNDEYRQLGIIVENVLYSAPRVITTISDEGQITGNFTEEETKRIAELMTAKRQTSK